MGLHLKSSKISEIKMSHPGDLSGCLRDTVQEWLKKNYNTSKFGDPSWRMIVEAVSDFNQDVARKIAAKHPGCDSQVPCFCDSQLITSLSALCRELIILSLCFFLSFQDLGHRLDHQVEPQEPPPNHQIPRYTVSEMTTCYWSYNSRTYPGHLSSWF